eukprot:1861241-Pyramimonas_sp.AAC.1
MGVKAKVLRLALRSRPLMKRLLSFPSSLLFYPPPSLSSPRACPGARSARPSMPCWPLAGTNHKRGEGIYP